MKHTDHAGDWLARGRQYQEAGNLNSAYTCYRKAVEYQPTTFEQWAQLGLCFQQIGRAKEAVFAYKHALTLKGAATGVRNNLAVLYTGAGRFAEAEKHIRIGLANDPDNVEGLFNLGVVLSRMGRRQESWAANEKVIEVKPDYAPAWFNRGVHAKEDGRLGIAMESFRKALSLNPQYANARWNLSLLLLAHGDLKGGWKEYECGLRDGNREVSEVDLPWWDGQIRKGQRILILAEQGVGDEVMFASCIPEMVKSGLDCTLECDARLIPLFSRSFPRVKVIARKKKTLSAGEWRKQIGRVDAKIASGSLLRYFRRDFKDFPQRRNYLVADDKQVGEWKKRFKGIDDRLKVGISWLGGAKEETWRQRSTSLLRWSKVLSTPGAAFIDLQYGDTAAQREALQSQTGLVVRHFDEVDPLHDLDGFAAQIAALDLVISIDNSTVHLSGALGVPTWILLPYVADCRWFLERGDSPWYQSVKLIRQTQQAQWGDVFEVVIGMLQERIGDG